LKILRKSDTDNIDSFMAV